jgi:hypothetical protein
MTEDVVALSPDCAPAVERLKKNPRPRLRMGAELFWILLRRFCPAWRNALIIVKPEMVVSWQGTGFGLLWQLRSRAKKSGRPKLNSEAQALIQQMVEENST